MKLDGNFTPCEFCKSDEFWISERILWEIRVKDGVATVVKRHLGDEVLTECKECGAQKSLDL